MKKLITVLTLTLSSTAVMAYCAPGRNSYECMIAEGEHAIAEQEYARQERQRQQQEERRHQEHMEALRHARGY